jgi:hypothetical protein
MTTPKEDLTLLSRNSAWKHFKGNVYVVVGVAINANADADRKGEPIIGARDWQQIVYHRQGDPDRLFVRSVQEWFSEVQVEGVICPRFHRVEIVE